MPKATEIAIQLLPVFTEQILKKQPMSYGYYANQIGRDPAKESIVIGQAMHAIGAVCVIQKLPIVTLYFVKRADGEARQIFSSNAIEAENVLPHFNILYVVAREYNYSKEELEKLFEKMKKVFSGNLAPDWSAHDLWKLAINKKPKDCEASYFQRALKHYEELFSNLKLRKS